MASTIGTLIENVITDKQVVTAVAAAKTDINALQSQVPAADTGTATATAGAATLAKRSGVITSEALTTAAAADYTLTITNTAVAATSIVVASVGNGTNTTEGVAINRVQPGAGTLVIHVRNTHASAALNGTLKIAYAVVA